MDRLVLVEPEVPPCSTPIEGVKLKRGVCANCDEVVDEEEGSSDFGRGLFCGMGRERVGLLGVRKR